MLMDSREALKTTTKSNSGMMTSFCALNPSAAVRFCEWTREPCTDLEGPAHIQACNEKHRSDGLSRRADRYAVRLF
jgi:hypothetical protein